MAQNVQYHSKGRNGDIVRKYWIKTCVTPQQGLHKNPTTSSLKSGAEFVLFQLYDLQQTLSLDDSNVCSYFLQTSHGSGVFNILGSQKQSKLHLYSFIHWLLRASMQRL